MSDARTWQMLGHRTGRGDWVAIGDDWFVRAHGCEAPIPVTLTEDPAGDYMGWIKSGKDEPIMIQHHQIFDIQFPYGHKAEQERGYGEAVRLRIEVSS